MVLGGVRMGFVIIIALAAAGLWWLEVHIHPVRRCPRCNGIRYGHGGTAPRWGPCRRCGGKGFVRRFGAPGE